MTGRPWEPWQLRPHGTMAAVRRHYRVGETPLRDWCRLCWQAQQRDNLERKALARVREAAP